jgi:hypothetical protein
VQSQQFYWLFIHCQSEIKYFYELLLTQLGLIAAKLRSFSSPYNLKSFEATEWELKVEKTGTGRVKLSIRDNLERMGYEGHGSFSCIQYCDMTPESRNNPLLDNGWLKHLSA